MTAIKASCPVCGLVDLEPDDLTLVVYSSRPWSYYAFDCPSCEDKVRKPADEHIVSLLTGGGVRQVRVHIPAEPARSAPPLTDDDLIAFGRALADTDDVVGMVQA